MISRCWLLKWLVLENHDVTEAMLILAARTPRSNRLVFMSVLMSLRSTVRIISQNLRMVDHINSWQKTKGYTMQSFDNQSESHGQSLSHLIILTVLLRPTFTCNINMTPGCKSNPLIKLIYNSKYFIPPSISLCRINKGRRLTSFSAGFNKNIFNWCSPFLRARLYLMRTYQSSWNCKSVILKCKLK